jgi:hypothetical protein
VREAVELTDTEGVMSYNEYESAEGYRIRRERGIDAIVARVMGDHPSNASGGHGEGRPARDEAPRA